ncbi:MAG: agmatinase [Methyloligellaceae bacterium]
MTDIAASIDTSNGLFHGPATFMGVPYAAEPNGSLAAVIGVPFDCGTHPVRIGARYGPMAIREQSALVRPYQPPEADFNPLHVLRVVDCGNVDVTPSVIEESFEQIQSAVTSIVEHGAVPVMMGGDGAVTLPQMRALHRTYPDLVVLHIDAHTDTYPGDGNAVHDRINTATTFTRAAEEGVVDAKNSFHVGARGTVTTANVFEHTRAQGYELIDGKELYQRGFPEVVAYLHERLKGRPVYLCFDMDFFDPSCAPGVCTPTWGGATAREGLDLLRGLSGLDFVAFDVNTVSPPHDVGGMTAFLAGTVIIECLALACRAPSVAAKISVG